VDLPGELALDVGDDGGGALEVAVLGAVVEDAVVALGEDLRGAAEVLAERPVAVGEAVDQPAKALVGVEQQELLPGVGDAVDDAAAPADADDLPLDAIEGAARVQREDGGLVLAGGGLEQGERAAVGGGEGAAAVRADDPLRGAEAAQGDRSAARQALDALGLRGLAEQFFQARRAVRVGGLGHVRQPSNFRSGCRARAVRSTARPA
jgi:hypothetical protein